MGRDEDGGPRPGSSGELLDVRTPGDLGRAFALAGRQRVDGLVVGPDGLTQMEQRAIVDAVTRSKLPAAYPSRDFVEAGGLMAYAVGAKPGDLPVEQPTRCELVINLKTARALGLTVPRSVLLRADQVIQ